MLAHLQAEPLALLDATIDRARHVIDPELLALVSAHIEHAVADGPAPRAPRTDRERDVVALIEQELVDVAGTSDELVRRAGAHFPDGALTDLVTAAYAIEARTRLSVAAAHLWAEP